MLSTASSIDENSTPIYTDNVSAALHSPSSSWSSDMQAFFFTLDCRLRNLENSIAALSCKPLQEELEMAKKIRRSYTINGVKHWVSGDSEQEIIEQVLSLFASNTRTESIPVKHNFGQYAENWFEKYSRPNISTVTAQTYQRQLRNYILPHLGHLDAEDITLDDVQVLFNNMHGKRETKVKCKNVLNMIFKLAVEEGIMKRNLLESTSFRLKGAASEETIPYSVEEMCYLIQHIPCLTSSMDKAYLALQGLHPLRLEEVLGLQWQDVDRQHMVLSIRRAVTHPTRNAPELKETKTGKCRKIALSATALQHLDTLPQGEPQHFIVGGQTPISYTQLRRMCARIARTIDFPEKIPPTASAQPS